MNKIVLVCGLPGSGKSTWIKRHLNDKSIHISRDEVRFSLLKNNDSYFAKEKETFKLFINKIQNAVDTMNLTTIYVDATHLNKKSRNKVLSNLKLKKNDIVEMIWFDVPVKTCLARNAQRTGRALVPEEKIFEMYSHMEIPTEAECKNIKIVKW